MLHRGLPRRCTRWGGIALAIALAAASAAAQGRTENEPVLVVADRWIPIGDGALLPAFATHPLDAPRPEIDTVVIVLHGLLRNADAYHANMMTAVRIAASEAS
jgi:hypothetical protein